MKHTHNLGISQVMREGQKLDFTMRTVLTIGLLSGLARGIGRLRRVPQTLLARPGREAGQGNIVAAAVLVAVYLVA